MATYYVNSNAQSNGDHEVHTSTCTYLPIPANQVYLGVFTTCAEAVRTAKALGYNANGCYYCSSSCHTS